MLLFIKVRQYITYFYFKLNLHISNIFFSLRVSDPIISLLVFLSICPFMFLFTCMLVNLPIFQVLSFYMSILCFFLAIFFSFWHNVGTEWACYAAWLHTLAWLVNDFLIQQRILKSNYHEKCISNFQVLTLLLATFDENFLMSPI